MKTKHIVMMALVGGIFSQPVFAISEAYRAQLEQSGCTQVDEANGTCNVGHTRHHQHGDQDTKRQVEHRLDSAIAGNYQGQAVDYMQQAGWHSINEERTRWRKAALVVDFDMTSSGKVMGVIVR